MAVALGGIVSVGGTGGGGGSTSGITSVNSQTGPSVTLIGVNGIEITSPYTNVVLIDGAGASGIGGSSSLKFAASFTGIISGLFQHNLNTLDVIVQIRDGAGGGSKVLMPDDIIVENSNEISVIFNIPQDGRVVIIG